MTNSKRGVRNLFEALRAHIREKVRTYMKKIYFCCLVEREESKQVFDSAHVGRLK